MEVMDAIKQRRSVRAYSDQKVPEAALEKVLEAARLAPSASNKQPWKFVVVRDKEKRQKLMKAAKNQSFVGQAPVIIAAVALNPEYIMSCEVPSYPVDLAIAVDHMTLAAVDEGLGTCWIGAFNQQEVKDILQIPNYYQVVALLPLGYPDDQPRRKLRKRLEEIVACETFSE